MNKNLIHFEKIKKIEIFYPCKDTFILYNDILSRFTIKINDTCIDTSTLYLKSRYAKQIKFETVVFLWLEKEGYLKNFSDNHEDSIIPADDYCSKNTIEMIRHYLTN